MIPTFRVLVPAILLVITMLSGNPPQTALAQFGSGPSEDTLGQQAAKDNPAVAEKPSPCSLLSAIPRSAVTQGSFTVWTVPEDPTPGKPYTIMVQIKGLNNLEKFPLCDIAGSVTGTDGYKDGFGGPTREGFIPVKNQTAQLPVVVVPGAVELVKDIIQIKSTLLKEEQQIEIKF